MVISKKDLKVCKFFTGFYKFYITLLAHLKKPMGEKRLFKALREKGIMDENKPLIPKKEYIEKGYFKLGNSGTKTLITATGIDFIKQSLGYSDEK